MSRRASFPMSVYAQMALEDTAIAAPRAASVSAPGTNSSNNPLSGLRLRGISLQGRPEVDIKLNGSHGAHGNFITSYSTMDKIEGTVNITASQDTRFDELDITFVGICKTFVDRLTSTPTLGGGRTTATHRFLRLIQPINDSDLPHPKIFNAGQTYSFPFTFVVPQQLLPRSCSHKPENDAVHQAHLQLPPSMGDPEVSGFASNLLDDMAPEMSKVLYVIKVRGLHYRPEDDEAVVVVERVRKIRIKPAYEEAPPLNVGPGSEYRLRQEKTIRKGFFKSKSGTLVMETSQPKSLHIPGARTYAGPVPISTVAKVLLRFDPTEDAHQPPKLNKLTSRLKVATYHSSTPRSNFPIKSTLAYDITQGYFCVALPLSSRCVANTQWHRHDGTSPAVARRDSAASTSSFITGIPEASDAYNGKTFWTASILVPITLPSNKNFLPSFHSCLVSRMYTLGLSLSTQTSPIATDLTLKVPIQVSSGASPDVAAGLEEGEEQVEVEDDVAVMLSRSQNGAPPPSDEYPRNDTSMELPPEYTYHAPRIYATNVTVIG